jgi:2-oxoglutarate dehydrogenase E1 component
MSSNNALQQAWATAYLSGGNMAYVDGLYEDYLTDPSAVPPEWQAIFQALPAPTAPEVSHRAIQTHFLNMAGSAFT